MPRNRRPVFTLYENVYPEIRQRIQVPQPERKQVSIRLRRFVRFEDQSPWYWVLHQRGVRRADYSTDPLEARAVPDEYVHGTLPERIVYRLLMELGLNPARGDFDFQTSLYGGRLELGGIVADFILPYHAMVLQVDGPTHDAHLRQAKDREQQHMLEAMAYDVIRLEETFIYNQVPFEDYMRRLVMFPTGPKKARTEQLNQWELRNGDESWLPVFRLQLQQTVKQIQELVI